MNGSPFQITLVPEDASDVSASDAAKPVGFSCVFTLLPSWVSAHLVVRCFFDDLNVMWMTLNE